MTSKKRERGGREKICSLKKPQDGNGARRGSYQIPMTTKDGKNIEVKRGARSFHQEHKTSPQPKRGPRQQWEHGYREGKVGTMVV